MNPLTGIPILHPSALVLTKIKRWAGLKDSTHPRAKTKAAAHLGDIKFLVEWLVERDLRIDISSYNAAKPERLYNAQNLYRQYLEENGLTRQLDQFRQVVSPHDMKHMGWEVEREMRQAGEQTGEGTSAEMEAA